MRRMAAETPCRCTTVSTRLECSACSSSSRCSRSRRSMPRAACPRPLFSLGLRLKVASPLKMGQTHLVETSNNFHGE
eukprot:scaffold297904_cov31-Tisochrysis_lutea.AAC.1